MPSTYKLGKNIIGESNLTMLQNLPTAFALLDKNRVKYCNLAFRKLICQNDTDLLSLTVDKFIVKRFFSGYSKLVFSITEEQHTSAKKELKIVTNKGTEQWVEVQLSVSDSFDKDNLLMMINDISHLKNKLEHQYKSIKQLHSLLEQAEKAIISFNTDGEIVSINRSFQQLIGLSIDETKSRSFYSMFEISEELDFKKKLEFLVDNLITSFNFELIYYDEDDKKRNFWCEFSVALDESSSSPLVVAICDDVTELKFLEEVKRIRYEIEEYKILQTESKIKSLTQSLNELIESRKDLKRELNTRQNFWYRLINVNPNLIFITDHKNQYHLVNKTFAKLLGKKVKEVIGKTDSDLGIKRLSSQVLIRDMPSFKHIEQDYVLIEETIELPDGEVHHFLISKVIVTYKEFQVDGNLYIATDITELKNTQLALSEQLSVEQAFQESIPAYIFRKDRNHTYIQANPAFLAFNGLHYDQLIGKTDFDFYPEDQAKSFIESDKQVMMTKEPVFNQIRKELTAEGKERWVSTNKAPYFQANGDVIGIIGLAFDITEEKEREDKLKHRYQIEKLILEISTRFINLEFKEIDKEINIALSEVAKFLNVNYALIVYTDDSRQRVSRTHAWFEPSIEHLLQKTDNLPIDEAPYFYRKMMNRDTIVFQTQDDIPESAQLEIKMLQKANIQSCIITPLVYENETKGSICFCNVGSTRSWSEDDVMLSRMISDIAVSALERKNNTLHIYKANQFIKSSVEANPMAIISLDLKGNITFATGKLLDCLGFSYESLANTNIRSFVNLIDNFENTSDRLKVKDRISFEKQVQDFVLEVHIVPLRIYHMTTGFIITLIDITEIKKSQDKISNQNKQLLAVLNQTDNLIFVTEPSTKKIIYANQRFREYYGDNCIDQVCSSVVQGDHQECCHCVLDIIDLNHGKSKTREIRDKNDRIFNSITQMITWIDDREVLYHTAIDISESYYLRNLSDIQNDTHIALSQSNSLKETISISLSALLKITGLESGGAYLAHPRANTFVLAHHQGCSREFFDNVNNFTDEKNHSDMIKELGFVYRTIDLIKDRCPPALIKEELITICHIPIVHQEKLFAVFTLASKREIELKQEALEAINVLCSRLSRLIHRYRLEYECEFLEHSINCIPEMVLIIDDSGVMLSANTEFLNRSGYLSADIIGHKIMDFQSGKHDKEFYKSLWKSLRAGQEWCGEIIVKYKNGSLHTMDSHLTPFLDEKGTLKHFVSRSHEV